VLALSAACSVGGSRHDDIWPPLLKSETRSAVAPADAEPTQVPAGEDLPALPIEARAAAPSDGAVSERPDDWTDPCLEVSELEVYDVLERFYRDFAHGDWNAMQERFWPGASVIAIRTREQRGDKQGGDKQVVNEPIESCIERLRANVARAKPLEIALIEHRIVPTGSIAQASIQYSAVDKSGDAPQGWSGTDAFTLVRHEGQWRIASLAFGSSSFGP
jgi:hypothetical protein